MGQSTYSGGLEFSEDQNVDKTFHNPQTPIPFFPAWQSTSFEKDVNRVWSTGEHFNPNSELSVKIDEINAQLNEPKNPDATIELIGEVVPHPDADRLDLAKILGFTCVAQKGLYKGGERIVYIRPDSLLPVEKWTEEYRKYSPKRIKAVKLRGVMSQGIIVPFEILPEEIQKQLADKNVGDDVGSILGVTHWEEPQPQDLKAKGGLPFGIHKTDEERFENLGKKLPIGEVVDIQLKVDGQSCSYFYHVPTKRFGVLGRTLELHEIFENNYTAHIARYDIKNKLIAFCEKHNVSLCIRGESYGAGIQTLENNPHSKLSAGWAMFSTFLVEENCYAEKGHQFYFKSVAEEMGLPIADMIEENVVLTEELVKKYSEGISQLNGKPFEGVVIKTPKTSFKIINLHYDSKK
jgi:RNA ligase (TIGR02306 family)